LVAGLIKEAANLSQAWRTSASLLPARGFGGSSDGYGHEDILRNDPTGTILSVINL